MCTFALGGALTLLVRIYSNCSLSCAHKDFFEGKRFFFLKQRLKNKQTKKQLFCCTIMPAYSPEKLPLQGGTEEEWGLLAGQYREGFWASSMEPLPDLRAFHFILLIPHRETGTHLSCSSNCAYHSKSKCQRPCLQATLGNSDLIWFLAALIDILLCLSFPRFKGGFLQLLWVCTLRSLHYKVLTSSRFSENAAQDMLAVEASL